MKRALFALLKEPYEQKSPICHVKRALFALSKEPREQKSLICLWKEPYSPYYKSPMSKRALFALWKEPYSPCQKTHVLYSCALMQHSFLFVYVCLGLVTFSLSGLFDSFSRWVMSVLSRDTPFCVCVYVCVCVCVCVCVYVCVQHFQRWSLPYIICIRTYVYHMHMGWLQ